MGTLLRNRRLRPGLAAAAQPRVWRASPRRPGWRAVAPPPRHAQRADARSGWRRPGWGDAQLQHPIVERRLARSTREPCSARGSGPVYLLLDLRDRPPPVLFVLLAACRHAAESLWLPFGLLHRLVATSSRTPSGGVRGARRGCRARRPLHGEGGISMGRLKRHRILRFGTTTNILGGRQRTGRQTANLHCLGANEALYS